MPKTYSEVTDTIIDLADEIREAHHPMLNNAKVVLDLLFVESDSVPVLSCHGAVAYAVCRIIGAKDRAAGRADAEIVIDKESFVAMAPETQRALIDHELHHLIVVQKNEEIQLDAQGRPKLKMRKHDVQVGWFHEVARRNGPASVEIIQAHRLATEYGQLYFPELMGGTVGKLPERTVEPENGEAVNA